MKTVILTTCKDSFEANLVKGLLEDNGIRSFLTNENTSNVMPQYTGMMGFGVQVMIDESDLKNAQELIKPQSKSNEVVCPQCHSSNVKYGLGSNKLKKKLILSFETYAN